MQETLQEQIATLESFLGHQGWTLYMQPDVLQWQAAGMAELLNDVGDKKGRNDFLRGQITAYKRVLKHYRDRLAELREQLAEQQGDAPAESSAVPPVI